MVKNMKCGTWGGVPGAQRSLCNSKDKRYGTDVALKSDKPVEIHLPGLQMSENQVSTSKPVNQVPFIVIGTQQSPSKGDSSLLFWAPIFGMDDLHPGEGQPWQLG